MEENIDYENSENLEENLDSEELEDSDVSDDSDSQNDSEEYGDESHEPQREKPQKIDIRERLSQVQRERYQAMQEADILRHENEALRKTAEIASGQALQQYDENLKRRYENARIAKARAMEEGDIQSQIDADSDLAMISNEVYQTNFIKAQNNYQSSQYQQQPANQYHDNSHHASQWVQENPWFNNSSEEFDPWLAGQVDAACADYDTNLRNSGQGHLIMSPAYLNEVNKYADSLIRHRNQNGQSKRELNMKQSRTPVSPVRNGYSQTQNSSVRQKVKPSQEEKDLARRLGVDEKTYLQYRLKDEKDNSDRRARIR